MTRLMTTAFVAVCVFAVGYVLLFGLPGGSGSRSPAGISFERVAPPVLLGRIRGRCTLERPVLRWEVPAPRCGGGAGTMRTESVVTSKDGGLGGCVVHLVGVIAPAAQPESALRIEATLSGFSPHVAAARVPVQVEIANVTTCDFNVHGYRDTLAETQFNFSSAPGSKNDDSEGAFLAKPGTYLLHDDIHPGCAAYLHLFDHPFFAVTSAEAQGSLLAGEYVLKDVPPGDHEVAAWHEPMTRRESRLDGQIASYSYPPAWTSPPTKVHVAVGETAVLDFVVPVPPEIPAPPAVHDPSGR